MSDQVRTIAVKAKETSRHLSGSPQELKMKPWSRWQAVWKKTKRF